MCLAYQLPNCKLTLSKLKISFMKILDKFSSVGRWLWCCHFIACSDISLHLDDALKTVTKMPKFNNIIENMFEIDIKTHCLISFSVKLFMFNMGAHIIFLYISSQYDFWHEHKQPTQNRSFVRQTLRLLMYLLFSQPTFLLYFVPFCYSLRWKIKSCAPI